MKVMVSCSPVMSPDFLWNLEAIENQHLVGIIQVDSSIFRLVINLMTFSRINKNLSVERALKHLDLNVWK